MKKLIIFVSFICCFNIANAQKYSVSSIAPALLKNASVVKRSEELKITIKSSSLAVIKHKYAVTILNEAGASNAGYANYYNKMRDLSSISGSLYDANGKELKSVKKKDIADFSSNDDISLMTDSRYKTHNFYYNNYPYTVAYEDEVELDGIFFLPNWDPMYDDRYSIEESNFIVEAPENFELNFKQIAFSEKPATITKDGKKIYTWQIKNFEALKPEPYQPSWRELSPSIYVAPQKFEIENYKGEMNSWLNLGKFINTLNNNKQVLPESVKQEVHKLTDNVKGNQEKAKLLYDYMQKNTRYISIQLGIGGWQPYDAKYVATKKYGDCKALSNYMVSLLNEANVPARYVLVKAGSGSKGLWEDFPSPYFNHAIMCVPDGKDTLWFECTSQTASAGYMGSFTGDRKVLLIDEQGGHVVSTPNYKASDNLLTRKVDATIDAEGKLTANVLTIFTGRQQENAHGLIHGATEEQKKKYLNRAINLPTYNIESFNYKEVKGIIPSVEETLQITSPNYATITGKRLFIMPNFFNRSGDKLSTEEERKFDIEFSYPYIDTDSIHINIPEGYSVESMPKSVTKNTPYGKYSIQFSVNNNVINVARKTEAVAGTFSKTEYNAIVKYFEDMYKADRSKIVLVKKQD